MVPKRYRVVLLAALTVLGVAGACVAVMLLWYDAEEAKLAKIREGMPRVEVVTIMGRPPDFEFDRSYGRTPMRRGACWYTDSWNLAAPKVFVTFENGIVAEKGLYDPPRTPWQRLRRWLHL